MGGPQIGEYFYPKWKEGDYDGCRCRYVNTLLQIKFLISHERRIDAGFNGIDAEKEESTKTTICFFLLQKLIQPGTYGLLYQNCLLLLSSCKHNNFMS